MGHLFYVKRWPNFDSTQAEQQAWRCPPVAGVGLFLLFIYLSVPFPVEDGGPAPLASVFLFNFLSATIGPLIGAFWGRQFTWQSTPQ